MNLGFVKTAALTVRNFASAHSTTILTSIGVAGVIGTATSASVATVKSYKAIKEAEENSKEELKPKEKIKICWKYYIPTAITGTITVSAIIGSNVVSARREAAIASAYALAEKGFEEYKDKIREKLGSDEEKKVQDEVIFDRINKTNSDDITTEHFFERHGDVLCYDYYCGRYFYSDPSWLRSCEGELNRIYLTEGALYLDQVYDEIGLRSCNRPWIGSQCGWELDEQVYCDYGGTLAFYFQSTLTADNQPVLVVRMNRDPKFDL